MSWELTQSPEVYSLVCAALTHKAKQADKGCKESQQWLAECWSENHANAAESENDSLLEDIGYDADFDWNEKYEEAKSELAIILSNHQTWAHIASDIECDFPEIGTTDNGGFNVYCCQDGCHCINLSEAEKLETQEQE